MKRFITSPIGISPAEKEKRRNSPTMLRRDSRSSLTSTTSSVRRELDRNLAFEKSPNGPMRDRVTVDILKINGKTWTISPLEAKNLIYLETLNLDRSLLLDNSFKGHPVITFCLKKQINIDTAFGAEHFVFKKRLWQWESNSWGQNSWFEATKQRNSNYLSYDEMG